MGVMEGSDGGGKSGRMMRVVAKKRCRRGINCSGGRWTATLMGAWTDCGDGASIVTVMVVERSGCWCFGWSVCLGQQP